MNEETNSRRHGVALEILVCPATKQPLRLCSIEEADGDGPPFVPRRQVGRSTTRSRTPFVMLREDGEVAYPVFDGVPLLLAPEMFVRSMDVPPMDVTASPYGEAYQEEFFYNRFAAGSEGQAQLQRFGRELEDARALPAAQLERFPEPKELWIDNVYDVAAQVDCYRHMAPVKGTTIMQLGGKGIHAVKFLVAGAAETWLVTPMMEEMRWAMAFAEVMGVADRLRCVIAIAEELPFPDGVFDGVYAGGTVHHLDTPTAMPEIRRVLRLGGHFAAVEPWRAPGYAMGTRIFGKREANAFCRPLTQERVAPMVATFPSARVVHHGAITRYVLIALSKLRLKASLRASWVITRADDAVASVIPPLRRLGSSVALLAVKE
jgi:uncharacterized protein YbaR (Trm112 family)